MNCPEYTLTTRAVTVGIPKYRNNNFYPEGTKLPTKADGTLDLKIGQICCPECGGRFTPRAVLHYKKEEYVLLTILAHERDG